MHGEVKLFVFFLLRLRRILDDCLLTVYSVLLQLVGEHTLHWLQ